MLLRVVGILNFDRTSGTVFQIIYNIVKRIRVETVFHARKVTMSLMNWGGNLRFQQNKVIAPNSIAEIAELIRSKQLRPVGTLHSFSEVATGDGVLVSASGLEVQPELDSDRQLVRVGAATRYGDLALYLEANGFALRNMGSLPHISLAGAAATGTHGSGDANPILSSSIHSFTFLNYEGNVARVDREHELFEACRLGLGSYGLWIEAELSVIPSFEMRQDVYRDIPWSHFLEDPMRLTSAGYSVSFFSKWGRDTIDQTWVKSRTDAPHLTKELAGISPQAQSQNELAEGVGDNLTEQGGAVGKWLHRLPHFRLDAEPSAGNEIQTEYFFERSKIASAIEAVHKIAHEINPVLVISEIRSIAKDEGWLSPMRRADSIALHFTWKNDTPAVSRAVDLLEQVLMEFDPIPHWGKVHHFDRNALEQSHPMLSRARAEFDKLDPVGKFSSEYLRLLGVRS